MAKAQRQYSARLKFQVAPEVLGGDKSPAQITKVGRVHPNSVGVGQSVSHIRRPHP